MGGKEDKFEITDEYGQLRGYDVSLARMKALEHAYDELPEKAVWLKGLSLSWEIKSAKFDEDEDCYRLVVLGYPVDIEFESKAEWEYHIDAKGNLYPGTPMLVSKGKWITNLPESVEESAKPENAGIERIQREQEEALRKAEDEKKQREIAEARKREQEEAAARKKTEDEEKQRELEDARKREQEEAERKRAEKERLQQEQLKRIEEERKKRVEEFKKELDPEIKSLVIKHKISFNGDQYIFRTHRYAKLDDAINYAEMIAERFPEVYEKSQKEKEVNISSLTDHFSNLEMIPIPAGTYLMGDHTRHGNNNESPAHIVSISPFFIAKCQVTFGKWNKVMDWAKTNGYKFINQGRKGGGRASADGNHPVTEINWFDAVLWCNALSEMEGKAPCYFTSAYKSSVYRSGRINIQNDWVDWKADGYRLPTEAEWEYACRANTTTAYCFGDIISHAKANYLKIRHGTTPVGHYNANFWGLYDMHGNVWEWCWDSYDSQYYKSSPSGDPLGPSSGTKRVMRGGSWSNDANNLRSAIRIGENPSYDSYYLGFRPVCRQ